MGKKAIRVSSIIMAAVALLACQQPVGAALKNPGTHFKKVLVVVLENTDYEVGLRQPFLSSLVAHGALLSNYSGISHPSQPNYIAMISGSTQGVTSDSVVNLSGRHLGDLLEAKGLQWKAYAEDYPGDCYLGKTSGDYARKHVPFISFRNVQNDPARCARVVDASQLDTDLQNGTLPDYSLYVPNLKNDGHNTGAAYADRWISGRFGALLQDSRFNQDLLFIVTFDESENLFGNHILTILYGNSIKPGSTTDASYNHYSLLRTIEEELNLGNLGQNDATANAINEVWK